jgi:hypothetical protein
MRDLHGALHMIAAMTAFDRWTEILRCPDCALVGVASLSLPDNSSGEQRDIIPEGFKR